MPTRRLKARGERRGREFTTSETLALHPIVLLFNKPEVREVMRSRNEDSLRFLDFQYCLCQELPSPSPKDCPELSNCNECHRFKRCPSTRLRDWDRRLSSEQLEDMRVFSRKSHLARNLHRLDDKGYIDKVGWGRYRLIENEQHSNIAAAIKKYLRRVIGECPVDLILVHESGSYFPMPMELPEEFEEDFNELSLLANRMRAKIGELKMKSVLLDIADAFERELSRMKRDKDRVYVERYLKNHIEIQLVNLGLDEKDFKDQVDGIFSVRLDIDKSELKRIEKEIEEEERAVRDARRDISKAFWLEQEASPWAEKYDSLMKKSDNPPSEAKIRRIKEILEREEAFQKWFENSGMCIPQNVLEDSPLVVIEHSTIGLAAPKPGEGQDPEDANGERERKRV